MYEDNPGDKLRPFGIVDGHIPTGPTGKYRDAEQPPVAWYEGPVYRLSVKFRLLITALMILALTLVTVMVFAQPPKIRVTKIERLNWLIDANGSLHPSAEVVIHFEAAIPIPSHLVTALNKPALAASYSSWYNISGLDSTKEYAIFYDTIKPPLVWPDNRALTEDDVKELLEDEYALMEFKFNHFALKPFDAILEKKWDGTTWSY